MSAWLPGIELDRELDAAQSERRRVLHAAIHTAARWVAVFWEIRPPPWLPGIEAVRVTSLDSHNASSDMSDYGQSGLNWIPCTGTAAFT